MFTWQTYNALFIVRNLCKYVVENLTEEVVLEQFEAKPSDGKQLLRSFIVQLQHIKTIKIIMVLPTSDFWLLVFDAPWEISAEWSMQFIN